MVARERFWSPREKQFFILLKFVKLNQWTLILKQTQKLITQKSLRFMLVALFVKIWNLLFEFILVDLYVDLQIVILRLSKRKKRIHQYKVVEKIIFDSYKCPYQ